MVSPMMHILIPNILQIASGKHVLDMYTPLNLTHFFVKMRFTGVNIF